MDANQKPTNSVYITPVAHSSPRKIRTVYRDPSSTSKRNKNNEEEEDEIQLVKVRKDLSNSKAPPLFFNTNRSPPRTRPSSPPQGLQSDPWQDASTEPMTPLLPLLPTEAKPIKYPFPTTFSTSPSNPITAPARISLSKSKQTSKRKADDLGLISPSSFKTLKISESQEEAKNSFIAATRPTTVTKRKLVKEQTIPTKSPLDAPKVVVPDKLTVEEKKPTIETPKPETIEIDDTKPSETSTATPSPSVSESSKSKKPTKEEEAAKVAEEIDHLMRTVKCLPNYYKLVDKIGEGTFSTVYKALDLRRDYYSNDDWEPLIANTPSTLSSQDEQPERNTKTMNQYVALKRIYHTSSPRRIAHEIMVLKKLKGCPCISPLITAFRQQDQVFVVMPYIQHDDFKSNYAQMDMTDIKSYLRSLFTALRYLHKVRILHRDVKPNNFLYNCRKKTGYLIDFGLAENEKDGEYLERLNAEQDNMMKNSAYIKSSREAAVSYKHVPANQSSVLVALTNKENRSCSSAPIPTTSDTTNQPILPSSQGQQQRIYGVVRNDARKPIKANRAGTKGFRAPEILMKLIRQTTAIDIWAAGVILLSFLSGRYPFFLANDEADSIVELSQIYGVKEMQKCAINYNRNFATNISAPKEKQSWEKICAHLNKEKLTEWSETDWKQGLDLLERCLDLNHTTRITAKDALDHPFLIFDDCSETQEQEQV